MKVKHIALIIVLLIVGCAGLQGQDNFVSWTPKQRAAYFMGLYNGQYDIYKVQLTYPDLTPEEKQILQTKKKILVQIYPMIQAYDILQASGATPSASDETAIIGLLDQLQRAAIRTAKK